MSSHSLSLSVLGLVSYFWTQVILLRHYGCVPPLFSFFFFAPISTLLKHPLKRNASNIVMHETNSEAGRSKMPMLK